MQFIIFVTYLRIENKRRSNCILKNLNPVWNYTTFYPNVYEEEVIYKTLELVVWDWDRFSKNDFMGLVKNRYIFELPEIKCII